jgi:acetyltransferase-like isoleucine patch superfamily enzyme
MINTFKKIYLFLKQKKSTFLYYYRRFKYFYFFNRLDVSINGNLIIRGGFSNNIIGKNLLIFPNCIFECFGVNTKLEIGNDCCFSYGVLISVVSNVSIGDSVWIGEYTSIRDSSHNFSTNINICDMDDFTRPIKIGSNVWIGRGCILLPGCEIGDNVIIGANSVVKGRIESSSLYAGSPARFIRSLIN